MTIDLSCRSDYESLVMQTPGNASPLFLSAEERFYRKNELSGVFLEDFDAI
jgi:hypothetical protein